jgi:hypothetical protein
MVDQVTIAHVSDPQPHVSPGPAAAPASVQVDWRLLHAGSSMSPGTWYSLALPTPPGPASSHRDRAAALVDLLGRVGFSSVTVFYLDDSDAWPAELPCPGWYPPQGDVRSALAPRPAMVAARAVWIGQPVLLERVGLDPRALVLGYGTHEVRARAVDDAAGAAQLPSGLWVARGPAGQVLGNSPAELRAKLAALGQ